MEQEVHSLVLLRIQLKFKSRPCTLLAGAHRQAPNLLPVFLIWKQVVKPNLDGQ